MNKMFKRTLLSVALIGVVTSTAFAATFQNAPLKGSKIEGYRPYMESIGSNIVAGGYYDEKTGKTVPAIGSVIEIPSYLNGTKLFNLIDKDGDPAASLGRKFSTTDGKTIDGKVEFKVEWYAIKPKAGYKFSGDAGTGQVVSSADHVEWGEPLPSNFTESNKNSKSLVVPPSVNGQPMTNFRLGFKATPTTEYGYPNEGTQVFAWDLSRLWHQEAPEFPGGCEEDPTAPGCDDHGTGGEEGENENGGGGPIVAPQVVVMIYDGATNKALVPGKPLKVDSQYYATFRIKDTKSPTGYRDPTVQEMASVKWNIVDSNDPSKVIASYSAFGEGKERISQINPPFETGAEVAVTFNTQGVNADALPKLQATGPNYSEQGWSLGVQIDLDIK